MWSLQSVQPYPNASKNDGVSQACATLYTYTHELMIEPCKGLNQVMTTNELVDAAHELMEVTQAVEDVASALQEFSETVPQQMTRMEERLSHAAKQLRQRPVPGKLSPGSA